MSESGKFYGTIIDPILKPIRKKIANEIQANTLVIDIACGTGAQVLELSRRAVKVVGVDHSQSMIDFAKSTAIRRKITNVDFIISDATKLTQFKTNQFESAIMSMALHQFSSDLYVPILEEMKRVAQKIIIVDYAVPIPKNYAGIGSRIVEFIAGKEHNRNYRNFCRLGGLNDILKSNNLKIVKSELFGKGVFQLVVCSFI